MSMSIRQFAKEIGVTDKAIRKAIKVERIPKEAIGTVKVGTRTMPIIANPDLATRCYRAGTQHVKGHQAGRISNPASPAIGKAAFAATMYLAKHRQLKFEKAAGLLVPRHKVVLLFGSISDAIKKIVPEKYHAAIDKAMRAHKDDLDQQRESKS